MLRRTRHCVLTDDNADWQEYIHRPVDVSVFDENGQVDEWLYGSITYSEYTLEDERVNRTLEEYERILRGKLAPWTPSRCLIHQIRYTLKYVSHNDRKAFTTDLKANYKASTREAAEIALEKLAEKWGK